MGNTITASMGINIAPFKKGLKEAENEEKLSASRTTARRRESESGPRLGSEKRVAKNIAGLAADFAAGGDAASLFADAAQRAAGSFKGLGLGILAGVAVGAMVYKQLDEAVTKANELREALKEAGKPQTGSDYQSQSDLHAKFTETVEAAKKAQEAVHEQAGISSLGGSLWQQAKDAGTGMARGYKEGGVEGFFKWRIKGAEAAKERMDAPENFRKDKQTQFDAEAEKVEHLNNLDAARYDMGERYAALLKIQNDLREREGQIIKETLGTGVDPSKMLKAEQAKAAQKTEEAKDAFDHRNADIEKKGVLDSRKLGNAGQTEMKMLQTQLDYQEKIRDARGDSARITTLTENRDRDIRQIAKDAVEDGRDKNRGSLGEIAKHGAGAARTRARNALREAEMAKRQYMRGNVLGGDAHAKRAEFYKAMLSQTGAIRAPDKDLQTALENAQTLKDTAEAVKTIAEKFGVNL